ncbi:MAG: GFA family protein [Methylococcales bacterium]|nr:GFA family protein [Methylococcales bacterium]
MKPPLTGGCLCGKVRYEISAPPVDSMNCHCRTCQKWTGTAYLAFMWIPADALSITGDYQEFATLAASGNTVYRGFCAECGTALFGRYSHFAAVRPVAAATLDDPSMFKPQKDIWVADAQPWDMMNPDLPKYAGNPTRPPTL